MSKITCLKIQEKDKERCSLYVDGGFCCGISLETAYKHHLKVGLELNDEQISEIKKDGENSLALSRVLAYCTKYVKTKKQVRDYLKGKEYSEQTISFCLDKLCEYKLIDDIEYAKKYIESSTGKGKRLIVSKLMEKGIKKSDIEQAFGESSVEFTEDVKILAQKRLKNKDITRELISKTYRYLLSRGFSYEEVNLALSEYKEEL